MPDDGVFAEDCALCSAQLRQADYDLWFSCLLVAQRYQAPLHAFYCFTSEISGMRSKVREPLMGEVRLQWWREVLDGSRTEEGQNHPQARALLTVIRRFNLPLHALIAMVDASIGDMYDDPVEQRDDLEGYWGETLSARMRLASLILADGNEPGGAEVCGHAGVALGYMQMLHNLSKAVHDQRLLVPIELMVRFGVRREQIIARSSEADLKPLWENLVYTMLEHLKLAEAGLALLPQDFLPLFAELGLVRPCAQNVERAGFNIFQSNMEMARFKRQWKMWRYRVRQA